MDDTAPQQPVKGADGIRLYCDKHKKSTCIPCLHSINARSNGHVEKPASANFLRSQLGRVDAVDPFAEENLAPLLNLLGWRAGFHPKLRDDDLHMFKVPLHTVHPLNPALLHNYAGLPVQYCQHCHLWFLASGGPGLYDACPSHSNWDDNRYIVCIPKVESYRRENGRLACTINFDFGDPGSETNLQTDFSVEPDNSPATSNLDNLEIRNLTGLLSYVADLIVPRRQAAVIPALYTNSPYFANRAWQFRLIVLTPLHPSLATLLVRFRKMRCDRARSMVTYDGGEDSIRLKVSPRRLDLLREFSEAAARLGHLGIQVYLRGCDAKENRELRERFIKGSSVREALTQFQRADQEANHLTGVTPSPTSSSPSSAREEFPGFRIGNAERKPVLHGPELGEYHSLQEMRGEIMHVDDEWPDDAE
ncbi:hypothetical protein F5Y15DRAFT_147190 [Xylariaceae sp. FL0016]|nr:hypothetical protein F5Y15DRAFT_147190 [Xylariaceae sp. FL0016]